MPEGSHEMVASSFRTILAQPDREHVDQQFAEITTMLVPSHPKVAGMLVDAQPDLLAFAAFPYRRWRQIWLTKPAGTPQHGEWEAGDRRYFSEASLLELTTMTYPIEAHDEAVILPELAAASTETDPSGVEEFHHSADVSLASISANSGTITSEIPTWPRSRFQVRMGYGDGCRRATPSEYAFRFTQEPRSWFFLVVRRSRGS